MRSRKSQARSVIEPFREEEREVINPGSAIIVSAHIRMLEPKREQRIARDDVTSLRRCMGG